MESTRSKLPLSTKGVVTGLALCAAVQLTMAFGLGWKSGKTESNYFTSLVRFQAAAGPAAPVTVVGSSITGRLPGREAGNMEVANLGTDGGSPADGLRLLAEGRIIPGGWIILEANSLERVVLDAPSPMLKPVGGFVFRAGKVLPLLSYEARPTAMLYAKLLGRRAANGQAPTRFSLQVSPTPSAGEPASRKEKARLDEFVALIAQMQKSGSRFLLVEYPSAGMRPQTRALTDRAIAHVTKTTGIPYVDLASQIPKERLNFTDSVHLAPDSARDVLVSLRDLIFSLP